jgi:DNA-binding transcriptional regulator YhcF (GntR family)
VDQAPEIGVDTTSPVAPYEQIRSQLDDLIRSGRLGPGQRLPPVRQLAVDLGLAAGTVARAYRELEVAGRVETRRGAGTTVVGPGPPGRSLAQLATAYVHDGRSQGHTDDELIRAVRLALHDGHPRSG